MGFTFTFPFWGKKNTTGSPHATGFTHEGYSLYKIIIACLLGICKGSFAQELC